MNAYQYVVLRLVPRVDREEFVNIGVVLHSQDAGFLDAGWEIDEERLRCFAPECDPTTVRAALGRIRAVCHGESGPGLPSFDKPGQRFGWIIAPRSTVIQPGPVHGGITADPTRELERLLDSYVRAGSR
ncbi:MAG: DUF3037 domain-containing protein [Intrasporangium sp.]|uniref:DUF3037 domain-containing protein n=1 Tax=Intrasporangium sp. TaxID=1925024 RepID=UPI00264A16A3|nr:DUF3037 domain-containing protein [Intrasporangium sp.]MDN5797431.1 DUF3037 domain-containing protein [Intrasporangium sp.]